jgi:hypothetical protein
MIESTNATTLLYGTMARLNWRLEVLSILKLLPILALGCVVTAQKGEQQTGNSNNDHNQLYLVAGTSLVGDDGGEPTTLYTASPNGALSKIRRLLRTEKNGQEAGYSVIRRSDSALFIVSNAGGETTVLHYDDPSQSDQVVIKSIVDSSPVQSVITPFVLNSGGSLALQLATIDEKAQLSLHTIMQKSDSLPRVTAGDPSHYASMLFYGTHGGGEPDIGPTAKIDGGVALTGPSGDVAIDRDLAGAPVHSDIMSICAATRDYLILSKRYTKGLVDERQLPQNADLFVHEKAHRRWQSFKIEGNSTLAVQLFGPWLAYTVGKLSFEKHEPGPGRDRERKAATWEFPSVQAQYEELPAYYPGVLCLLNIEENRTIRIVTGQEDSEILLVDAGRVIYRVNDTIYLATITGSSLGNSSVIARGDDVPEVHWAFYGK